METQNEFQLKINVNLNLIWLWHKINPSQKAPTIYTCRLSTHFNSSILNFSPFRKLSWNSKFSFILLAFCTTFATVSFKLINSIFLVRVFINISSVWVCWHVTAFLCLAFLGILSLLEMDWFDHFDHFFLILKQVSYYEKKPVFLRV